MSGKIYIASTSAGIIPNAHTYLIYDVDGDTDTFNDQTIINAGPTGLGTGGLWGNIFIDSDLDVQSSVHYVIDTDGDGVIDNDPEDHYNYTELDLGGASASTVWASMTDFADNLINADDISYNPLGPNSNSITSSVLSVVGLDFETNTPNEDGNGTNFPASNYPGYND